jgi:hypothetical protein
MTNEQKLEKAMATRAMSKQTRASGGGKAGTFSILYLGVAVPGLVNVSDQQAYDGARAIVAAIGADNVADVHYIGSYAKHQDQYQPIGEYTYEGVTFESWSVPVPKDKTWDRVKPAGERYVDAVIAILATRKAAADKAAADKAAADKAAADKAAADKAAADKAAADKAEANKRK